MRDVEAVIAKMTELKRCGLKFSLDDFGTGYSSLSYLGRLPLHELKIDHSFVENILDDGRGGAIAQTIISLGSAMGLSVIAEGVETEQRRRYPAHLGCDSYQGFLFSALVPVEQFEMLLWTVRGGTVVP
jgi:EAL domain-containing protein (putative c-di-GMP-specific phosphodiesterase class I)